VVDGLRPGEVEIRRALAECMTVADIDDAMGWPPGTARRRRWRALERGGLPAADAELGGVAIWFRSTIEHWLTDRQRPRRPRSGAALDSAEPAMSADLDDSEETAAPSAVAQEPVEAGDGMQQAELGGEPLPHPQPEPAVEEPDVAGGVSSVVGDEVADDQPDRDHAGDGEADGHEVAEVPDVGEPGDVEPGDVEPGDVESGDVESVGERDETVGTGFELESGQWVLAEVHGRWREAQVVHRDRATVVVNYSLDGTPLGARRQRIDVHRVRLRPAQG
jgi:hypothetical protein